MPERKPQRMVDLAAQEKEVVKQALKGLEELLITRDYGDPESRIEPPDARRYAADAVLAASLAVDGKLRGYESLSHWRGELIAALEKLNLDDVLSTPKAILRCAQRAVAESMGGLPGLFFRELEDPWPAIMRVMQHILFDIEKGGRTFEETEAKHA